VEVEVGVGKVGVGTVVGAVAAGEAAATVAGAVVGVEVVEEAEVAVGEAGEQRLANSLGQIRIPRLARSFRLFRPALPTTSRFFISWRLVLAVLSL
jgi:hypothetical protein